MSRGYDHYRNSSYWLLLEKLFRGVYSFILWVMIARLIGPLQFGQINFALSVVVIVTPFFSLGMEDIFVRELVCEEKTAHVIGTVLLLRLVGALAALLLICGVVLLYDLPFAVKQYILLFTAGYLFSPFHFVSSYYNYIGRSYLAVLAQLTQLFLFCVVYLICFLNGSFEKVFIYLVASEPFFIALLMMILFLARERLFVFSWDGMIARRIVAAAWPLFLMYLANILCRRVDIFFLEKYCGFAAVGTYSVAVRMTDIFLIIPFTVTTAFLPFQLQLKKSLINYGEFAQKLYYSMVFAAVVIAISISLFVIPLISLLWGRQFLPASGVLMVYIWTLVFSFLGSASQNWLIGENMQMVSFVRSISGLLVVVLLCYILVPIFGPFGAAFAVLGAQAVGVFCVFLIPATKEHARVLFRSLNVIEAGKVVFRLKYF